MKVLVCGSRSWRDTVAIEARLLALPIGAEVIHGDAPRGADRIARRVLESSATDLRERRFPADWEAHCPPPGSKRKNPAGVIRNRHMLNQQPDLVIAFWDGESRGTADTIEEARKRGIPVEVISA